MVPHSPPEIVDHLLMPTEQASFHLARRTPEAIRIHDVGSSTGALDRKGRFRGMIRQMVL